MRDTSHLFAKATNPKQYDSNKVIWKSEIGISAPFRMFLWEYLKKYTVPWKNKNIIDIGAGTGWMTELIRATGAKSVIGIDPSKKNIKIAKKYYPNISILNTTLEEFIIKNQYDIAILNMSISHMKSLDNVFAKLKLLIRNNGEVFITIPDYDYFKKSKWENNLQLEQINNKEYVVSAKRTSGGIIADVVRKIDSYIIAAQHNNFLLLEKVAMPPTELLMQQINKYKEFKNQPITHLLRFKLSLVT